MIKRNFDVKDKFFSYLNYLRSVSGVVSRRHLILNNRNLKAAASRVNVPTPFFPYISLIEKSTKRPFPQDLGFTVEEVRDVDKKIIDDFSVSFFSLSKFNLDRLFRANHMTLSELGLIPETSSHNFQLMSIQESAESYIKSTSAGYPFFRKKEDPHAKSDAINWTRSILDDFKFWDLMTQPIAVFHRFQYKIRVEQGYTIIRKKIRPVWGVPFRVLVLEGVFFRNMLNSFIRYNQESLIPLTGIGKTRFQISESIIKRFRSKPGKTVSVDYERFDSRVPSFLWALFFASLEPYIDYKHLATEEVYKGLMAYSCFSPYCWNSTKLCFQKRGIPSGSLLTSLFGTYVNRLVINYAFLEANNDKRTAADDACVLGDDLIFKQGSLTLSKLISVAAYFGLVIRESECLISSNKQNIDFLGYFWDIQNRPIQVEQWYIAHLSLPSRFIDVRASQIPLPILQTYRGISLCMGIYQGMSWFEKLVGYGDYVYIDLLAQYRSGNDPVIQYVGEDQRLTNLRIPFSLIFGEGWQAF